MSTHSPHPIRAPRGARFFPSSVLGIALASSLLSSGWAEDQPSGIPQLNSRPGAAYTIYLNVGGFNFDGEFAPEATNPGFTPALNDVAPTGSFNAAEQTQIRALWSRVAQSYVGLNVNVTTVDPAVAAGHSTTDAMRQAYYDSTPMMMHTVIGSGLRDHDNDPGTPMQSWIPGGGADGTSALNVVMTSTTGGRHTNFMLSEAQAGSGNGGVINGDYIGGVASHENGHAFGLHHQSDYDGINLSAEYSVGDAAAGSGSWVPIMGNASDRQRVAWRVGSSNGGCSCAGAGCTACSGGTPDNMQNDLATMLASNAGLNLVEDGIGHTRATATNLPLVASAVDFNSANGVIVPASMSNPDPANMTEDWFRFTLAEESTITLTAHNSTQLLTAGQADGVGTLRSELTIFDVDGIELMQGTEAVDTLLTTYSDTLAAGTYFAQITGLSPHDQVNPDFDDAQYYNMGAYFLTGDGFTIPEPGSVTFCLIGTFLIVRRRRHQSATLTR